MPITVVNEVETSNNNTEEVTYTMTDEYGNQMYAFPVEG